MLLIDQIDMACQSDNPYAEIEQGDLLSLIILTNNRIAMIRLVRAATGMGLKESKDFVWAAWPPGTLANATTVYPIVEDLRHNVKKALVPEPGEVAALRKELRIANQKVAALEDKVRYLSENRSAPSDPQEVIRLGDTVAFRSDPFSHGVVTQVDSFGVTVRRHDGGPDPYVTVPSSHVFKPL